MSQTRGLIVGLGSIGQRHWKNLQALGVDDFVFVRTGRSTLANAALAEVPTVATLAEGLACQPTFVVIANPTAYHLETAQASLAAGCHVLVEKPVSHTLEGCGELLALQAAQNRVGLVGYQFRFHPGLLRLKQLLEAGVIGRPVSVRVEWGEYLPGWHPWEDYRASYSARADLGGGVLLTLSHPLDYLLWLFGRVQEVAALATRSGALDVAIPDNIDVQLGFASGVTGQLHLDYLQRPSRHTMHIVGQRGQLAWDNSTGDVRWHLTDGNDWQHTPLPPEFERNHLFLAEMDHFLKCITGAATPVCSLADGVEALRLALAAETAAATHQVVTV